MRIRVRLFLHPRPSASSAVEDPSASHDQPENQPLLSPAAKATFAAAGLADRVTNYLGDARGILPTLPDGIDIVFIDADKSSTRAYFELLWPKIRVGGVGVTDNVISHQAEMAGFVDHVRSRGDAHSVQIPRRAGVEWTVKVG